MASSPGPTDFLPQGGGEPHGYNEFIATVDVIVLGPIRLRRSSVFPNGPMATRRLLCSVATLLIFLLCEEPEPNRCPDPPRISPNYRPADFSMPISFPIPSSAHCVFTDGSIDSFWNADLVPGCAGALSSTSRSIRGREDTRGIFLCRKLASRSAMREL